MYLAEIAAPVTAATVVSVFLFAGVWRANQIERVSGNAPWQLTAGVVAYGGLLAAFLIMSRGRHLTSRLDLFAASLAAQAFAGIIVYCLVDAFILKRSQPWRGRAQSALVGIGLSALVLGAMVQG